MWIVKLFVLVLNAFFEMNLIVAMIKIMGVTKFLRSFQNFFLSSAFNIEGESVIPY